jgi:hypothetical protein
MLARNHPAHPVHLLSHLRRHEISQNQNILKIHPRTHILRPLAQTRQTHQQLLRTLSNEKSSF